MLFAFVKKDITNDLVTIIFSLRASEYAAIAGYVVWIYDIFLTLEDEIVLLWTRRGTAVKALYLVVRT